MEDGRLPLTNNLCESHIRLFATARRAWLFADTPKGAKASAVLYTLVESAKANDLDVYGYLKYLLTEMPNNRHLEHPEVIDRYCRGRQSCRKSVVQNTETRSALRDDIGSIAGRGLLYHYAIF